MTTKVVGYCRVSGDAQAGETKDGLPRQARAIAAYAKAHKLEVIETHTDAGVSGRTPLAARAGLSLAVARAQELGVKVLLIESASRLARDLLVNELLVQAFAAAGVGIVACDSGQDLCADDSPTRRLVRQLCAAIAEHDRATLTARLRAARDARRQATGRCEGPRPFGQDPARPAEAAALERLRELRRRVPGRRRATLREIAAIMTAEGHATRSGKAWSASVCRDLLAS
jgi:DNA invertase Pin-like site-specific DNA recombinase